MNKKETFNPEIHYRKSIRIPDYDYSKEGFYFVTICCQDMVCRFGYVVDGKMVLNECGKIAKECWEKIPNHFLLARLHSFVIMPNHIHGIIEITENVGAKNFSPNIQNVSESAKNFSPLRSPSKSIGSIVRGFKIGVTKWIRQNTNVYKLWQRNYYEHVIRNEHSYNKITEYIHTNPLKWEFDKFYHL
jgi:putative transposase